MELNIIINSVVESDPSQWYGWEQMAEFEGGFLSGHHALAVYRPNCSIQMVAGRTLVEDYEGPWTKEFADPRACSVAYVFLWNGFPIHEGSVVFVDGGRAALPNPEKDWHTASPKTNSRDVNMARIVHSIVGADKDGFDEYLERANMIIED